VFLVSRHQHDKLRFNLLCVIYLFRRQLNVSHQWRFEETLMHFKTIENRSFWKFCPCTFSSDPYTTARDITTQEVRFTVALCMCKMLWILRIYLRQGGFVFVVVCLSVCLSVSSFAQKLLNGFAWNLQGRLATDQWTNIKFWWRSPTDSPGGGTDIATLVRCALAEVCSVPVVLVHSVIDDIDDAS